MSRRHFKFDKSDRSFLLFELSMLKKSYVNPLTELILGTEMNSFSFIISCRVFIAKVNVF